jgi:hypothetical protein
MTTLDSLIRPDLHFFFGVMVGLFFFAIWLKVGSFFIRISHSKLGWFPLLLDAGTASPDAYVILFILTCIWPVTLSVTLIFKILAWVSRLLYRRL